MKHNLDTLQIKGLEQKIREYNVLHRKIMLSIGEKNTVDFEKELNGLTVWFRMKGLSIERSTLQWELFIESLHGNREEKAVLVKIREEKAELIQQMLFEEAQKLRSKEKEILQKWAKPVKAQDFYRTFEVLNYVDQFVIRKNTCDYYL